jgi:hypothetical protein
MKSTSRSTKTTESLRASPPSAGEGFPQETDHTPNGLMAEVIENLVRERAYELYVERGFQPGHAETDWYTAENEVLERLGKVAAA